MSEPVQTPTPMSKVFIGNLAFRTTDLDLQTLFKECGEIKTAVIITRGRRSLGYGFVEFVNPADAAKSVDIMNKKDFLGRPLKVELAKDPSDRPPRTEQPKRTKPVKDETLAQPPAQPAADAPAQPSKPRKKKARKQKQPQTTAAPAEVQTPVTTQPAAPTPAGEKGPAQKRKRTRKPKTKAPAATENGAPAQPAAPAEKKAPAPKKPAREQVLSTTTLFVANLPFTIDDEGLAKIFEEFKPKSAHVVRTRTSNRSRGYGFVVFENEEDQKRAKEAKHDTPVPGATGEPRKITISISTSVASSEGGDAAKPATEQKQ